MLGAEKLSPRSPVVATGGNQSHRTEEREGWRFKDAWVGAHTDAELIGASMYEVEPVNKQGPFHTHHANEEWVIVLRVADERQVVTDWIRRVQSLGDFGCRPSAHQGSPASAADRGRFR